MLQVLFGVLVKILQYFFFKFNATLACETRPLPAFNYKFKFLICFFSLVSGVGVVATGRKSALKLEEAGMLIEINSVYDFEIMKQNFFLFRAIRYPNLTFCRSLGGGPDRSYRDRLYGGPRDPYPPPPPPHFLRDHRIIDPYKSKVSSTSTTEIYRLFNFSLN